MFPVRWRVSSEAPVPSKLPIDASVLDRLGNNVGGDLFGAGELDDGSGDAEDLVAGADAPASSKIIGPRVLLARPPQVLVPALWQVIAVSDRGKILYRIPDPWGPIRLCALTEHFDKE